jgi:D-alanyl-D-alanine dipeptidase
MQVMAPSGPQWVSQFPTSRSVQDLVEPFRSGVRAYLAALSAAGASVTVADTLRPPQRAYLMHYSFAIAREGLHPSEVPPMAGVDIQWLHTDAGGDTDINGSTEAAEQMVQGYGIAFRPALTSRHTDGCAIDMTITWQDDLTVARADGTRVTISTAPRSGDNADLHQLGASYGVIKLVSDPPHWSVDGH